MARTWISHLVMKYQKKVCQLMHWKYVCELIDECVDNIIFPLGDENALRQLEEEFMSICHGVFPGTVAAGDGIVFQMIILI